MMEMSKKIALITGVSSGIGREIAVTLVRLGMTVIGCARRVEKLKELSDELNEKEPGKMITMVCDVSKEDNILSMFATVKEKYGALHVFINNVGIVLNQPFISGKTEIWRSMLDVNIMAPAICGREAFKLMKESGVTEGNIIFMNSTLGKKILERDVADFYTMTKHALTVMVQLFRREIASVAPHIRCSSVTPGATKTEIWYKEMGAQTAEKFYKTRPALKTSDVAEAVVYILKTPVRFCINDIELETPIEFFDD